MQSNTGERGQTPVFWRIPPHPEPRTNIVIFEKRARRNENQQEQHRRMTQRLLAQALQKNVTGTEKPLFPWKGRTMTTEPAGKEAFSFRHDIDRLFDQMMHERWSGQEASAWQPAIDVYESESAYIIVADLPGVNPAQVDIHVEGDAIMICGSRARVVSVEITREITVERIQGRFCRTVRLEHDIAPEAARAEFWEGIYTVLLPKRG